MALLPEFMYTFMCHIITYGSLYDVIFYALRPSSTRGFLVLLEMRHNIILHIFSCVLVIFKRRLRNMRYTIGNVRCLVCQSKICPHMLLKEKAILENRFRSGPFRPIT